MVVADRDLDLAAETAEKSATRGAWPNPGEVDVRDGPVSGMFNGP